LAADQIDLFIGSKIVYILFYDGTTPFTQRDPYYSFIFPPDTLIDGTRVNYEDIINHSIIGSWTLGNSGVNLAVSLTSGWINGSVTNMAAEDLTIPVVRMFRISNIDPVNEPHVVTEIVAEISLPALIDGASDTFSAGGGTFSLGVSESLVVAVQNDADKEVLHAVYVPSLP
jgi:hypothetical protein